MGGPKEWIRREAFSEMLLVVKKENREYGLCTYESEQGCCPNRALLGGDRCGLHKGQKDGEGARKEPVPVEIPARHLKPDFNWKNWKVLMDPISPNMAKSTHFRECPFCAAAVHESSGPMHSKWHEGLITTFASMNRAIEAAYNAR